MSIRNKIIKIFYKTATGSRKLRTILTPLGLTFFFLLLALLIFASLKTDEILKLPKMLPSPINFILSLPVLAAGLFLILWSILNFIKVKGTPVPFNPPPEVVSKGPYRYIRNPMLTGLFSLFFGLGILIQSISLSAIYTPLFILFNVLELKLIEESELEKRFGTQYLEYKKNVPMFIPRFKRKKSRKPKR